MAEVPVRIANRDNGYQECVTSTTPTRRNDGPASHRRRSIATVLFGERSDGITMYAQALADNGRPTTAARAVHHVDDLGWEVDDFDAVHVHVSDRLIADSDGAWNTLVQRCRFAGVSLVATLHDLPQRDDCVHRNRRRSAVYRSIAGAADIVIVSSESERGAASSIGIDSSVVPHPIFPIRRATIPVRAVTRTHATRTIVVAGFVHPGKGVAEMVDAIGDVRGTPLHGWQLRLVGSVTERHRDEPTRIEAQARANGLDFRHIGAVSDRGWSRELSHATVGVCPHLHCSASGSILSWIAHGRRPVATSLPFSRELADERRDALTLVERPLDWRDAIETAARESYDQPVDSSWRTPAAAAARLDGIMDRHFRQRARTTRHQPA